MFAVERDADAAPDLERAPRTRMFAPVEAKLAGEVLGEPGGASFKYLFATTRAAVPANWELPPRESQLDDGGLAFHVLDVVRTMDLPNGAASPRR